ncbi:hypothetical protein [Nocardia vaccinii]|uniref:hypothetical protein n=1 Tax=Nocardia vaccinii TaxID=1822 RepID=UPI0008333910|nr:hypothetical protein [Nocardia vaccinii]
MSGRGHKAVTPPPEFQAAERIAPSGTRVAVINKEGFERVFDFTTLPVPTPMQQSLAQVFAEQSFNWNSHASGESYWQALRAFARFLSSQGHPAADLDRLTAATMRLWRNTNQNTPGGCEALAKVRTLLQRDPHLSSGPVSEELARRAPRCTTASSKQSYDRSDRELVVKAAERQFRSALLRIRANAAVLTRFRSGVLKEADRDWQLGRVLQHLADTGDVPRRSAKDVPYDGELLGGRTREFTWGRLFLTRQELTALAVLMTDLYGWNLSVYDRLTVPTTAPTAGTTAAVTYNVLVEKRRLGAGRWFVEENYTDTGAGSAGRLITQALEATRHGRALAASLAPGTDLLMVARQFRTGDVDSDLDRPRPVGPLCFGVSKSDGMTWAKAHGIGSPFQRARRTTVVREGKPLQHSRGTHESVYVLPDKHVQKAAETVIAAGAQDALQLARDLTFRGRLTTVADPHHQETATADCADETSSPWLTAEGTCGADFLLCLSCRNARVHTGHHPRLALLHQQLLSMRSVWPDELWRQRWDDSFQRLVDLRTKVNEVTWDAALARVTDHDREIIAHLLKGELAP